MTTIVNPGVSETSYFNRSGKSIVNVAAGTAGSPTPIPNASELTIALVTVTATDNVVQLPTGNDPGDVVEIYNVLGLGVNNLSTVAGPGETILSGNTIGAGIRFRKVSTTQWAAFAWE
jgi:hypothetical protein